MLFLSNQRVAESATDKACRTINSSSQSRIHSSTSRRASSIIVVGSYFSSACHTVPSIRRGSR